MVLVAAALAGVVVGLMSGGAAAGGLIGDPGAVTRWGLPLARTLSDLAAALTVGLLTVTVFVLPAHGWEREEGTPAPTHAGQGPRLGGVSLTATRLAASAGTLWVVAAAAVVVLSYSSLAGTPLTAPGFAAQLGSFVTSIDLLRALLASTLLAAVAATGATLATRHSTVGWMAVVSLVALLPVALTGHSAALRGHELAVDSLAAHLTGVSVWVGGLAALVLLRREIGQHLAVAARRYSTLALWCFVLVAVSGVVNATVRLGAWGALASPYGALVIAKALALILLGMAGWRHRAVLLPRVDQGWAAPFWRLVTGELVLMGMALGLGVALSASEPPLPSQPAPLVTIAESLTGFALPPAPVWSTWLTAWRLDLLWAGVALVLAGAYLVGVRRMRARGDRWPMWRAGAWLLGCALLVWVTSGAPGIYGRVLFSAHMFAHMMTSMVVPPLLVLGAPVTLAMRTMTARRDGSRGPREWLMQIVHSRALTFLSHPLVAAGLFAVSLTVFYYSPLFELSLRTHTGHVLMNVHFLLTGYLFASVLIGVDPGRARPAYPLRLLILFATMAFHAFFGVELLQGNRLLAPDVLAHLGRTWGRPPLADQQYGGAIAWAVGEVPTLLLGIGVALAWVRSDDRETRRGDRAADRDGGAELAAYNARLAALAERASKAP